jgi:hypothetical protein
MKTAVSIPDDTFLAAEKLAQERGLKRSQLYDLALKAYLKEEEGKAITEELNKFYANFDEPRDLFVEELTRRTFASVEWED